MTVKDVYDQALGYLFEQPGDDADFMREAPGLICGLLADALPYENAIRKSRGQAELESPPKVTDMAEEIPYDEQICRSALPYGLAGYFWQDECDDYKAQDYRGRFLDALIFATRAVEESISDEYPVGND